MRLGTARILLMLIHAAAACEFGPVPYSVTGIVCRMTKPAALLLNQETARLIQAAFKNAKFPNITGERSMRLLGTVAYTLANIQVSDLSIEQSEVELKENDAIDIAIKNVTAFFRGTLTYGYAGAWFLQLFHSVDFEIESSIDLQINIKLLCQEEQVAADASDCYLSFHKLKLHLQGDKEPGWLKQLFTDFISFTLKFVLKREVCKEINLIAQVMANFVHDIAENFVRDEAIGLDISLASDPLIKANYLESHHKGLVLYKNYSDILSDSVFSPSLLSESRMLYFWLSEHILNSLASAAFLDGRLELTLRGEKLQVICRGCSSYYMCSWSEMGAFITRTHQQVYSEDSFIPYCFLSIISKYSLGHLLLNYSYSTSLYELYGFQNDRSIRNFLQRMISAVGIPEVISKIEPALTSLMNSKGLHFFEIKNPEIITRKRYLIVQLDFSFPNHLLLKFLKQTF
uniref:Cholesteryl ester transfer protein n=1 Tax=Coturnix japonica TaxID=93934 RepID=A0A8C2YBG7_COTJA